VRTKDKANSRYLDEEYRKTKPLTAVPNNDVEQSAGNPVIAQDAIRDQIHTVAPVATVAEERNGGTEVH
jgi:hypothetical protein